MNLSKLVHIANRLDSRGYSELANELDEIIKVLASDAFKTKIAPEDMSESEIESGAEDIIMMLAHQLQQSGYDVSAQTLHEIFQQLGKESPEKLFDPDTITTEIEKRRQ